MACRPRVLSDLFLFTMTVNLNRIHKRHLKTLNYNIPAHWDVDLKCLLQPDIQLDSEFLLIK